jgi:hypothetical protein
VGATGGARICASQLALDSLDFRHMFRGDIGRELSINFGQTMAERKHSAGVAIRVTSMCDLTNVFLFWRHKSD